MKSKAYMDELRMKDAQELENELMAAKKELFNLRFQISWTTQAVSKKSGEILPGSRPCALSLQQRRESKWKGI